ncbi:MAG: hypothetical protein K2J77_10930 [Oscillospiraceae bacterium]|nr:hypothetical protein [Oscillospiraceae bacterium]
MKKFLSILLSCAFLAALAICLTGCKGRVTERQLKNMVEKALEEKYSEEFECSAVLFHDQNGSYKCLCYPENNPLLKFEAAIYSDGHLFWDHYPTSIVASELSKTLDAALGDDLGKHFIYAYSNTGVHDTETARKIAGDEFTLDYFLRHGNEVYNHNNLMQVNYFIIVDVSTADNVYEDEWDNILNALDSVHRLGLESDIDLYFRLWIYFVPADVYTRCLGYFERNAVVRSGLDQIAEGFPREYHRIIHFDVGTKTWVTLTKEEYVELRKTVD